MSEVFEKMFDWENIYYFHYRKQNNAINGNLLKESVSSFQHEHESSVIDRCERNQTRTMIG